MKEKNRKSNGQGCKSTIESFGEGQIQWHHRKFPQTIQKKKTQWK